MTTKNDVSPSQAFCEICLFKDDRISVKAPDKNGSLVTRRVRCGSDNTPHPCPGFKPLKNNA